MLKQVMLHQEDGRWVISQSIGKIRTWPERVEYDDDRPSIWIEESEHTRDARLIRGAVEQFDETKDQGPRIKLTPYGEAE
jgi:hypothetical protein